MNNDNMQQQLSLFDVEVWRDVPGYDGNYAASNHGRVMRTKTINNAFTGRVLKPGLNKGYLYLTLVLNKQRKYLGVHQIVALAFLGYPPEGYEVNHKDGNKLNNCINNLEYCTPQANSQHAFRIGLNRSRPGEECKIAKLTWKEVDEIRRLYATKQYTQKELGALFGVNYRTIGAINLNKIWKR
jgi:hypothetical protein